MQNVSFDILRGQHVAIVGENGAGMQARLIRMSYFEARSHQQIADELGMPLGTVKSTLRRAFLRLQLGVRGAA